MILQEWEISFKNSLFQMRGARLRSLDGWIVESTLSCKFRTLFHAPRYLALQTPNIPARTRKIWFAFYILAGGGTGADLTCLVSLLVFVLLLRAGVSLYLTRRRRISKVWVRAWAPRCL